MEKNNGRTGQEPVVDTDKLIAERDYYQKAANELLARNRQLENAWVLSRAEFLFKVVGMKEFSEESRMKAREELETFLFPAEKPATNKED